jgi:hypothetical protein
VSRQRDISVNIFANFSSGAVRAALHKRTVFRAAIGEGVREFGGG